MSRLIILLGIITPLFLSGCPSENSNQDTAPPLVPEDDSVNRAFIETFIPDETRSTDIDPNFPTVLDIQHSHWRFALADYREHSTTDSNFVSAPFDIQQLLSMTALGADGTSLEAIASATGINFNNENIFADLSNWEHRIDSLNTVTRQRYLWGQERYHFADSYLQNQARLFSPTMSGTDFQAASMMTWDSINESINTNTPMTSPSSRTRLIAAQNTEITAEWSNLFTTELVKGRFADLENDEQRWVGMVRIEGIFNASETDDYRLVEIPLFESELSLLLVTPSLGRFHHVRSGFDETFLQENRHQLAPTQLSVAVPLLQIKRSLTTDELPDLAVATMESEAASKLETSADGTIFIQQELFSNDDLDQPAIDPDLENSANFSRVNNRGFLYLLPPKQDVDFSLNAGGVITSTSNAIQHEAKRNEPDSLIAPIINQFENGFYNSVFSIEDQSTIDCFYPPDQRPFLYALYANETGTLLHLGHVVELYGDLVDPDWSADRFLGCGDSPHVDVYKHSGAIQCEFDSGIGPSEMKQTLIDEGIEVLKYNTGYDGLTRLQVCGENTGDINVFTIGEADLTLAEQLGFMPLEN